MDKNFLTENQRKYVISAVVILGVYLFMKFLSPVFSPFIFAFLFAGLLNKITNKTAKKIKKFVLAGVILILALAIVLLIVWLTGSLLFRKGGEIAGQLSSYEEELNGFLGTCCDFMESSFGIDGNAVESYVLEQVNIFIENMEVRILPAIMDKSVLYVKSMAGIAGFFVIMVIAMFLILKDYEKIMTLLRENSDFKGVLEIISKIILYLKTYLKAQIIILLIISSICALTLGLSGIKGGIAYGIITGFMDMLPFIGTGIMLMPVAFFQLISENYWKAAVIVCLYVVCALLREFLEPKLIGNKVGIWPVGILFSVFAGIKLFGIFGIIKGPVGLVIICETCKYLFRDKEAL